MELFYSEWDALVKQGDLGKSQEYLRTKKQEALDRNLQENVLVILNEMLSLYRESGQYEQVALVAEEIMQQLSVMNLQGTMAYATSLLNVANAYRAAGILQNSERFYQEVSSCFANHLAPEDRRYASLYNNQALLMQEMNKFEEALGLLRKALSILQTWEEAEYEVAVTYANIASTLVALHRMQEAMQQAKLAGKIFAKLGVRDQHAAAAEVAYADAISSVDVIVSADAKASVDALDFVYRCEEAFVAYCKALFFIQISVGESPAYLRVEEKKEQLLHFWDGVFTKGMYLSEAFYWEHGAPMIHAQFEEFEENLAVGVYGEGSDCLGYDDLISRDHDFGPGFCIWMSAELYDCIGLELEEAYRQLPNTYHGVKAQYDQHALERRGVSSYEEYFRRVIGIAAPPSSHAEWKSIAQSKLRAVVSGKMYSDPEGIFSGLLEQIRAYYPREIELELLAYEMYQYSQNLQYNYPRACQRKDELIARVFLSQGVVNAVKIIHILNKQFVPHDKWLFRSLEDCKVLADVKDLLQRILLAQDLDAAEEVAHRILLTMVEMGLLSCLRADASKRGVDTYIEHYREELGRLLMCPEELIEEIIVMEWKAFDGVKNIGGRASCQDDWPTFSVMRRSQYRTWSRQLLEQYHKDFSCKWSHGWNPISEKYAWMMESTDPDGFQKIAGDLPERSSERCTIIDQIVEIEVAWMEEFAKVFPKLASQARSIRRVDDRLDNTSYETYLRGELNTYSDIMLSLYGTYIVELARNGINHAEIIMEQTVNQYGYATLEEANSRMQ